MLWLGLYTLTLLFMKSEYCNINSMEIRGKIDLSLETVSLIQYAMGTCDHVQ